MAHPLEGSCRKIRRATSDSECLRATGAALRNSNVALIVGSWRNVRIAPEPKSNSQKGADRMKRIMILGGVLAALAVGIVAVAGAGAQEDT